jgi:hypothetical protein
VSCSATLGRGVTRHACEQKRRPWRGRPEVPTGMGRPQRTQGASATAEGTLGLVFASPACSTLAEAGWSGSENVFLATASPASGTGIRVEPVGISSSVRLSGPDSIGTRRGRQRACAGVAGQWQRQDAADAAPRRRRGR